ncbi:MAG: hypothetical protein R6W76_18675 [Caldilinea sp.]
MKWSRSDNEAGWVELSWDLKSNWSDAIDASTTETARCLLQYSNTQSPGNAHFMATGLASMPRPPEWASRLAYIEPVTPADCAHRWQPRVSERQSGKSGSMD